MFGWLRTFFTTPPLVTRTLIQFRCDGCMGHDWVEVDRGIIVGRLKRVDYGSSRPNEYYVVERPDGSRFEAYVPYCMPGEPYMQQHTNQPDESLVGKMVYIV